MAIPEISIIMPAYNEGPRIYDNVATTMRVVSQCGRQCEIVVVDDGSSDGTLDEIRRAAADIPGVVAARNPYNMGKGMALRTGFEHSRGDIAVFLDADLDLHPGQVAALVDVLNDTPCDVVVTSKHHPDSHLNYPLMRKIMSWGYYQFIKVMFGLPVRDTQTGLKVFRRKVLERVLPRLLVKKFAYDVELLATAIRLGYRVREVPVVIDFRRALNWGRISLEDIRTILVDTLAVFYRLRIMRYYDRDRKLAHDDHPTVLVCVKDCPPPDDVVERLVGDTGTRIACIGGVMPTDGGHGGVRHFDGDATFNSWLDDADDIEIVAYLGEGCLPVGGWVRNAARHFDDPSVNVVCGPSIPGPQCTYMGRTAALLFGATTLRGPDSLLHSYRPERWTYRRNPGNMFVRRGMLPDVYTPALYDPDVAVFTDCPPLILPALTAWAREMYIKGRRGEHVPGMRWRFWRWFFPVLFVALTAGWFFLSREIYYTLLAVYSAWITLAALATLSVRSLPALMIGLVLFHCVRAVAYPMGVIARILSPRTGERV